MKEKLLDFVTESLASWNLSREPLALNTLWRSFFVEQKKSGDQDFLAMKITLGRPKLLNDAKRNRIVGVRFSSKERKLLERAASDKDQNLSDWARATLLVRAGQQLRVRE